MNTVRPPSGGLTHSGAIMFHIEYPRAIPARRPEGHQPAAPRFSLRWRKPLGMMVTEYFALQGEDLDWTAQKAFFDRVIAAQQADGADHWEIMRADGPGGTVEAIIVCYWLDATRHARWTRNSAFFHWLNDPARLSEPHGLWRECSKVPYDRHETIYSAPGYRIGLSRTSDAEIVPITMNGYFGAARDRMPISAIDALESPFDDLPEPAAPASRGARITVCAPHNAIVIRSGQFWEEAGAEQDADYQDNLRPKLMRGMDYLSGHKTQSGTLSLRNMTNLNPDGSLRRETSTYGHFLSLRHLEDWAQTHETHLDIYRHAIAMNRLYKERREVVTWHEVFALIGGQHATYMNCHPETGLLPFASLVKEGP